MFVKKKKLFYYFQLFGNFKYDILKF
jgi:hypothetical protein